MRGWIGALVLALVLFSGCATQEHIPGADETGTQEEELIFNPDAEVEIPDIALGKDGCEDSDHGFEIHEMGITRLIEKGEEKWVKEDYCYDSGTLYEYYCEGGALTHDSVKCPCADGVCDPILDFTECVDSDGGNERFIRGEIRLIKHYTDGRLVEEFPVRDKCISGVELIEYFCKPDGGFRYYVYTCSSCNNGVCSR